MLQRPGRGTIVVERPVDADIGHYQCFAENRNGIATSNAVFVHKYEFNAFVKKSPKSVVATEGEPLTLQCEPPAQGFGWPKPGFTWILDSQNGFVTTINDARMTVDPTGNLHFSNVTRSDASDNFSYTCKATQNLPDLIKNTDEGSRVLLDVQAVGGAPKNRAPQQQFVSTDLVALRGKSTEMFCIYSGTPLPSTTWYKDDVPIEWNDRIVQGSYGKSLIIRHTNFKDAGSYRCDVSNGVGSSKSSEMSLQVNSVPYFTQEPRLMNAAEEEEVEFRCEAAGIPEPSIHWIYNGKPISEAPYNSRRHISANRIVIQSVTKQDMGNYGCNASNTFGYVYRDVFLNVLTLPPEITMPPRVEVTVDNRAATLNCGHFGVPKPKVAWTRRGSDRPLTESRYQVQENGTLVIQNVEHNDQGEYTCKVTNKLGSAEASGRLDVKSHTQMTDKPLDAEIAVGQQARFLCAAKIDNSLEMKVEWYKNNELIEMGDRFSFESGTLTISRVRKEDAGQYTCVIKTELDEVESEATLLVVDVPNAPRLKSINCGERDATILWEYDLEKDSNNAPILKYEIHSNTPFSPDTWNVAQRDVPPGDFTNAIPMTPWANYTFRVVAFNKVGASPPSNTSEPCVTKPDVPFINPLNVKGEGTNPTNLVISWDRMPQIQHNGPDFQYRVHYKRDIPKVDYTVVNITDWEQNKLEIPDQPTFARYKIMVRSHNALGDSNVAAEEIIGYSGEDIPTEAPANFTLVQVTTSTSALLSWDPVANDNLRGHFKGYKIQTWTDIDGKENLREIHIQNGTTRALVVKFRPDSKNYAQVLAYNSRYNGPPSAVIDFQTPEGVPSTVQSLEAYPLGSSGFLMRWEKPRQPNGRLTGYEITSEEVVDGTKVLESTRRTTNIRDARITQAKVADLEPGKKYRLHIAGTTKAGTGEE